MVHSDNSVVLAFLKELKELSKKHNMWIEGDDIMIVDQESNIVADYLECENNEKYIAY